MAEGKPRPPAHSEKTDTAVEEAVADRHGRGVWKVDVGTFAEGLRKLVVSTVSPGGAVKLRMTIDSAQVELAPGCLDRLREAELADEIEAAWRGAVAGKAKGRQAIREKTRGRAARPAGSAASEGTRHREAALREIDVEAVSRERHVRVRRQGADELSIRFSPRVTRHLDETELNAEINSTLRAAGALHRERRLELLHERLQSHVDNRGASNV